MITDPHESQSVFKVNPSKPTRSHKILTDLYTSYDQVSSMRPTHSTHFLSRYSSTLNPSIWLSLTLLGLVTAFIAFTIDYLSQKLLEARYYLSSSESLIGNFVIWILFSLFFAVIAASTGKFISIDAEGSGIPEVKSILSGVHISKYLSISTLSAKIAGLIAGCAAGLSIGKEGPFVHISAILANKMTKLPYIKSLPNSLTIRNQILGASVACGVAAAFGAPVGGVIFSIEATSTYYVVSNLWKGVFCAIWCMLGYTLFHMSEVTDLIHLTKFEPIDFSWEILAFALLGVLSGLLGAGFVYTASKLIYLRSHMAYPQIHSRFRYTIIVALVCAIVNYSAAFLQLSDKAIINQMFRAEKLSNYEQLYWNNPSTVFNLTIYVVLKLLMTALSISCPIPCGFVAPVFTGGAAFGRLYGYLVDLILNTEHKGIYAVVGAASLVSSVTHTVSIAIIVFELTGQMNYILPMMVGVLISYSISASLSLSMYNVILKIKRLPYLPFIKPSALYQKKAIDVSSSQVTISEVITMRGLVKAVKETHGFNQVPIIDDEGYLVGDIEVEKLKKMIIQRYARCAERFNDEDKEFLNKVINPVLRTEEGIREDWNEADESCEVNKFFEEEVRVDEGVNDAPLSVSEALSLVKVQFMFIMMGVVQVYVVRKGKLVGVVSRETLAKRE